MKKPRSLDRSLLLADLVRVSAKEPHLRLGQALYIALLDGDGLTHIPSKLFSISDADLRKAIKDSVLGRKK